jgi:hypothetical protein
MKCIFKINQRQERLNIVSSITIYLFNLLEALYKFIINNKAASFYITSKVASCTNVIFNEETWQRLQGFEDILKLRTYKAVKTVVKLHEIADGWFFKWPEVAQSDDYL